MTTRSDLERGGRQDRSELGEEWQRGFAWLEQQLGGEIVRWESQARWRPAWFLELERPDGERVPLYWRGARAEFHGDLGPLEREGRVIEILGRHGIPVPHVYGLCSDPPGLVLARVPGRFNLAKEPDPGLRRQTLDRYLELLAKVHAIDPAEFEAIGLRRPADGERSCLGEMPHFERRYRAQKKRPDPMIEFQLGWLKRNVPKDRDEVSFLVCDSGQFLFDRGRVTALIDLEIAYLGDRAADLAGLRTRDLSEPLGDLAWAMERYEQHAGVAVDRWAIDYHTVRFSLTNPLALAAICADPVPSANHAQYLAWYVVYSRCPLEVLAHMTGTELDPPALPEPAPSRQHAAARHLVEALAPDPDEADPDRRYERDRLQRTALYVERADRYGRALEADDLDDVAAILGHRPRDWAQGDAELEAFVLEAGPERDAELIRFFHRQLSRQEFLLQPTLRELAGAVMPPIV